MTFAATAIGAGIGGIGAYFGGQAQAAGQEYSADINKQLTEEQLKQSDAEFQQQFGLTKQEYADTLAAKTAASGIIQSGMPAGTAPAPTMDYANPLATPTQSALTTMLSGQLTPAQLAQQQKDIATANQGTDAVAATSGLPAGARAALTGQNAATISNNYANMAENNIATGVSGANSFANTGLNVANTNYQSALTNFLNQQKQANLKATTLAGYAT